MRTISTVLVATLMLLPAIEVADAQELRATSPGVTAASRADRCCGTRITAAETEVLAGRLREGVSLAEAGRLADARRLLKRVVRQQKAAGLYPADALRRLANVEYALDRPMAAAQRLEELAWIANNVGDPQTELDALVDASILYAQHGLRERQRALVPSIQRLLESPMIPVEKRREIAKYFPPA